MAHESTHGCTRKPRSGTAVKPEGRGAVQFYDGTRLLQRAGLLLTLLLGCGPLGAGIQRRRRRALAASRV